MGTHRAYQRKAAGGHAHRLRRAAAVSGHRDGLLLRSRSNGKTRDTAFGCVPRFRPSKNAKKEKVLNFIKNKDEMGYRNAIEQHFYVYKKLIYDRAVLGEQNKGQSQ